MPSPFHAGEGATRLWVARSCFGEATWNHHDCASIFWVYRKRAARAGVDWFGVMRRYSEPLKGKTARSREILTYPWGDVPGKSARFNRNWTKLRELATRLVAGEVPDPCPEAIHFGGRMDVLRPGTIPARCAAQGLTANTLIAKGKT